MQYKITIPYLQIGEFRVETPVGLSELLQDTWSVPNENDEVEKFASKYDRTVFKNENGQLVTKYTLKSDETK